jgi:nitrogen regulatory protein PII
MEGIKPKIIKKKLLLAIIDFVQEKQLTDIYLENHLPLNVVTHGHGTASSEMLDYLGLGETKKSLTISIISEDKIPFILGVLSQKLHFEQPGKGVAFTLPMSCISSIITSLDSNDSTNQNAESECEEKSMKKERKHELIIIIVNQGYADQTMEAAKKAGANGGTVVHARGLGDAEAAKFLEITVQPEKELILILTKKENKMNIMESVNKAVGLTTQGKGIMLSLPVDETVGIGADI